MSSFFKNVLSKKNETPPRGHYRARYSQEDMEKAFNYAIENQVPVQRAAKMFNVPVSTLKDRVRGRINVETVKSGPPPLFTQAEEASLAHHIVTMADVGYGYARQEILNLASDHAIHLGYREKDQTLSTFWLYSFIEHFPELKLKRLRKSIASYVTKDAIENYFNRLVEIMETNGLAERPQCIYNIEEKGLSTDVNQSVVVVGRRQTAGKDKTVTMMCASNAAGDSVPPYFVFPGKKMKANLLEGAVTGADGTVSENGWCNTTTFSSYMKDHLLKFLPARDDSNKVLVLYDGHRSHVSLGLIEWAKDQNIVLFVSPPHTTYLFEPLDVECFQFETAWLAECRSFLRVSGKRVIARQNVCQIACKAHSTVMTTTKIISSFRKSGVYPVDKSVVPETVFASSLKRCKSSVEDEDKETALDNKKEGEALESASDVKKPRNSQEENIVNSSDLD